MIDTAVWTYLDDRRAALRRQRAEPGDHLRPLIEAALAELDAIERWADQHDGEVSTAELARIAEQIRRRREAGEASVAPGPVTPTQHGPHLRPPTHEFGVAGPGAVDTTRSRPEPRHSISPVRKGGADVAPPKPGEGAQRVPTTPSRGGER